MQTARFIACIIATTAIGWSVLNMITFRSGGLRALLKAALGYGVGMGLVAFQIFLYYFAGWRVTLSTVLLPWLPLVAAGLFLFRPAVSEKAPGAKSLSLPEILLALGISFQALLTFFRAFLKPIESFDSVAMYAMRAKIVFMGGGIPPNFFSEMAPSMPNPDYPLLLPLAEAWTYIFMGGINDLLVKALFPLYFICLLVASFFLMRRFISRKGAFIFTFAISSVPQLAAFGAVGYADVVLTYYYTIGAGCLFLWGRERRARDIIIAGLFLGFAIFTKNEGMAMFLASLICLGLYLFTDARISSLRTLFKALPFVLIVLIIAGPWLVARDHYDLKNNLLRPDKTGSNLLATAYENLDRSIVILYEYQKQFFGPKKWNIIWIIALVLFALNIKAAFSGGLKYITLSIILILMFYASVYILMDVEGPVNWYVASGVSRLFIHVLPLAVFWIAHLAKDRGLIEGI